jgi:hypothetical protein
MEITAVLIALTLGMTVAAMLIWIIKISHSDLDEE